MLAEEDLMGNSNESFIKSESVCEDETSEKKAVSRKQFLGRLYEIPGAAISFCNDVDDEPCPPGEFEFINGYRYSPNVKVPSPESMFGCEGCHISGCHLKKPQSCSCLDDLDDKHRKFAYNKDRKVIIPPRHLIIECNRYCSCGPDCATRVVQRGRLIPLEIFKTPKKGWAVRTQRIIQRGMFIDVYRGEVIDHEEAERRGSIDHQGSVYLFDLDFFSKGEETQEFGSAYTIDARHCGNVTRFFNHSCDPNIAIWPVVGHELARTERLYELAFFAIHDIKIGEELCFNYHGEGNQKKEGQRGVICHCGSEKCTGEFFIL
ncbi:Histone-lysine N-methyltransferase, H3 lysine-9 specific [Neolecta irregularis DAH-3]|uniref:Histone-lysine N-methyltransferase, H3 lysine-9 specific n=1 Tax=Neolecta irregularis (strain DAH-3) TaxID=1198029 RepID=A0A1U7LJK6_NEOID|nr:Histone-lysine N-methyltransferase, H3 lysine-9 specific [Neolecta irregularis DAH-3]|eukprot:OLL22773.1 Histone-lysine N-methyltransferase, H3 lysine-9 specific [Neolecta irregularis DAH-3]